MIERIANRRRNLCVTCLACVVLTGCGGVYDSTVSGVVTLDGAAVPRGTVSFTPQSGGPTAYGLIQSDGAYTLRTGREEGLPHGVYTATVSANEAPAQAVPGGGPPPTGKSLTPQWYRDPNHSGLSFTVADGVNEINLELTSTPPAGWKAPPGRR